MRKLIFSAIIAGTAGLAAAGCTNTPGSPSVSFTIPLASGPNNGSSYKFKAQPVTVSITNAVRTGTATATYNVEVASDAAFANKVFTQSGIAEGGGGTTSLTLSNLAASSGNVTYYWRWTATVDGVTSGYSPAQSFVVQQQIIVNAPTLVEPANGITTSEVRPKFVIKNATRQGAVGTITYIFQVSKNSAFTDLVANVTVTEQSGGQTSWTPTSDLPTSTLYWRAQARDDSNTETSGFTSSQSLVVEPFDPTKATFWNGPNVSSWPQTATITLIDFSGDFMVVDFDRRASSNPWPQATSSSFGPVQYTLGMCFKISGQWHCSAPVQFWEGRELEASGPWRDIADNWYYDSRRWGPMAGHQPAIGELVVVWAGEGNLRGNNGASYQERTNFVVIPFGTNYRR